MPISRLMTTGLNIDHMVIHFFNPHNGSNYASRPKSSIATTNRKL